MPRVSAEHLTARREQILWAALRCFERSGFHATSMRDVVRESGLSAGAVYSYFPSKDDLVAAAVEPILTTVITALDEVVADGTAAPTDVVRTLVERIWPVATGGQVDYTRVAVTAWGEALRDPAVRRIAEGTYGTVRTRLGDIVAAWRDAGHLPGDTDARALAQVLFSVLVGLVLQHALLGDVDLQAYTGAVGLLLPDR